MTPHGPDHFGASPRLRSRSATGLPAARRPALALIVAIVIGASTLAFGVGSANGAADGVVAAAGGLTIGAVVIWIRQAVVLGEARPRLRALREQAGDPSAVAVRSTAGFAASKAHERDLREERRKPGRAFQLLTLDADGFELRERPAGGPGGVAFVPWASVESIRVGSAEFADVSERAILVAADVHGHAFLLGLSPLDDRAWWIRPAPEHEYLRLIEEMIRRAGSVHSRSDAAPLPSDTSRAG
ncbi:hypothetical protein [Agromyces kandeliae]|uniref:Uncharacterized protein n=1 Tax=Agromyces kandeliae TaxID=2666141 RepID=A0A6L5R3Y9_9MICO|nr:hypothetical protein [Agromyces kandeliae]MRX44605.1 hypothetical protein [Agromyces kandeliae]